MERNKKSIKYSNDKAITLIALIITIITMLILVGTSVSLVIDSDLIGVAQDAANKTETKYQEEAGLSGVAIGDKTYNSIEEYIADQGGQTPPVDEPEGGDGDGDGNGTTLPAVQAGKKAATNSTYSDGTNTAVIPAKFTVSGASTENTIAGGLVIYLLDYKLDEDGNKTTEPMTDTDIASIVWTDAGTLASLRQNYDQFVWIPIKNETDSTKQDINDMYICQNKGTGDYGTAACVITVPEATGVATCSTHGNCTAMAGRLYANATGENFENNSNYTETYTSGSGLREPDTVSYDGNSTHLGHLTSILGTTYSSANDLKIDLQTEYNNVVKSVYLNQGFYVGRYETSNITRTDGTAVTIRAGKTPSGSIKWYYMYAQQRDYATNNSLSVGSTMIQGAAYDQVMKFVDSNPSWIKTTGRVGHSTAQGAGSKYQTGGLDYKAQTSDMTDYKAYNDVEKNIYDLEGNVRSWTTEAYSRGIRIYRGGSYDNSNSASYRYGDLSPDNSNYARLGSTCQLYVK